MNRLRTPSSLKFILGGWQVLATIPADAVVFLTVVQSIQKDGLRDPTRLMGFVRTIVRRQVSSRIDYLVHARRELVTLEQGPVIPDRKNTPEEQAIGGQQVELMISALRDMPVRHRDLLTRFYLHEQTQDQICRETDLTERNITF